MEPCKVEQAPEKGSCETEEGGIYEEAPGRGGGLDWTVLSVILCLLCNIYSTPEEKNLLKDGFCCF